MRASRAPEGRGINKRVMFISVIIVAIIAAVVVIYFSMGSDSISAKNEQATVTRDAALTSPSLGDQAMVLSPTATLAPPPTPIPPPTAIPAPNPTPAPASESTQIDGSTSDPQRAAAPTAQPGSATVPTVIPDARFGEILEEGLIELRFPAGDLVNTWYSFQVDTETRDITLLFAQYDDALESILSTVKIEQYTRGADLENAEVALYFPNGSTRVLLFDRGEGTIRLDQQYALPVGPSMFSSGLRRALVYYGIDLQDETGDIQVKLHLDLSGLSLSEGLGFKRLIPGTVDDVLLELRALVEQIEDRPPQR
jgi:hypothetical protein